MTGKYRKYKPRPAHYLGSLKSALFVRSAAGGTLEHDFLPTDSKGDKVIPFAMDALFLLLRLRPTTATSVYKLKY